MPTVKVFHPPTRVNASVDPERGQWLVQHGWKYTDGGAIEMTADEAVKYAEEKLKQIPIPNDSTRDSEPVPSKQRRARKPKNT